MLYGLKNVFYDIVQKYNVAIGEVLLMGVKNMTTGVLHKVILKFAVPIFIGIFFQQFYTIADAAIIGHILGVEAFAGVGSVNGMVFLVMNGCLGLGAGLSIMPAQSFGARNEAAFRQYAAGGIILCLLISVMLTAVGIIYIEDILLAMQTPISILSYAYDYILWIILGVPVTLLFNYASSMMRAVGDSCTPTLVLIKTALLNILLDIIFMGKLHMGVEGAALATIMTQILAVMMCLRIIGKNLPWMVPSKTEFRTGFHVLIPLLVTAIPMGVQSSVIALGIIVLQVAVNGMGATVIAGVTAADKLYGIVACPIDSIAQSMAAFAAQHTGAGKIDRLHAGVKTALKLCLIAWLFLTGISFFGGSSLVSLFVDSGEKNVIFFGHWLLFSNVVGFCFLAFQETLSYTVQGMGYSRFALLAGLLETVGRSAAAILLTAKFGFAGICLAVPLAWVLADFLLIPLYACCRQRLIDKGSYAINFKQCP